MRFFLNFTATYEWKDLNTNQIVGTTREITVNPMVTTMYQVKRTLSGTTCPGYDTVTVTVGSNPIIVDLGPDTAICAPNTLLLDAGYHGLDYAYNWYKGTVHSNNKIGSSQTYLVSNSGSYIAVVTDTVNGCIYRDTINVTVNPEVKVYPDTFYVCDTMSRTYQFDAGDGYLSYMWNGDPANNSRYYSTNVPGYHIVEVLDSNGCIGIDTGLLVYRSFSFKLPNDTVICPKACVFVPVKTDSALINYAWNDGTSDTSRTICNEGSYILTITDSLGCTNSDTINIYEHPDTSLNLSNYGPVCWEDTFLLLIKPVQDDLGYFNGAYVNLDTFWIGKGAAGPGIHKVKYNFIDTTNRAYWNIAESSVCWLYDSLNVLVAPLDSIYIDTLGPLCLNAPIQPLVPTPPGGIFKDSSGATIDSFLASNYGVGTHLITYTYIDSNGCKYTTQTWVQVTEAPTVVIKYNNDYCVPCYGTTVWAVTDTIEFPNLKYYWSNGDTTRNTRAHSGDTLIVSVYYNDSICYATDTLIMSLPSCCDLEASFLPGDDLNFTHENPLTWVKDTLVIDRDIFISHDFNATIDSCFIVFKCDARIVVENDGNLSITNSQLGHCDWEGIEVHGDWDACSDVDPGIGDLFIRNSTITCANVGILSGARDYTTNNLFIMQKIGGRMDVASSHFFANYVDVMFTPHSVYSLCNCTSPGDMFQSKINNNTFDTLANDYKCYNFVDPILADLSGYFYGGGQLCMPQIFDLTNAPVPFRCHIIDLSPYIEYYVYQLGSPFGCSDVCLKRHWESSFFNLGNTTNSNTFIGKSFNLQINNCHDVEPAKSFK